MMRTQALATMPVAICAAAFMLGCEQLPEAPSGTDALAHHNPGHEKGGGDGGGGDDDGSDDGGSGGVLFDLFDETEENGLKIAEPNHGDLFNDGGRWLDLGFVGNDGLPAVDLNYDATQVAFGEGECSPSNTTSEVTATDLADFLVHHVDATEMVSGRLTVDKKGDEGGTSTDHRVAVQFDDSGSGHRILVALTGKLAFGAITVDGDATADPADLTFTGGTVRVRAKLGGSSSNDPHLDCPHGDFVEAWVDRQ